MGSTGRRIPCDQLGEVQQWAMVVGHPCREVGRRLSIDPGSRHDKLLTRHDHLVSRTHVTHEPRTRSARRPVDNGGHAACVRDCVGKGGATDELDGRHLPIKALERRPRQDRELRVLALSASDSSTRAQPYRVPV